MALLTSEQIGKGLKEIPEWKLVDDSKMIEREYRFSDFAKAMEFADTVAVLADAANHHPTLTIAWGSVQVQLSTHDVGGLSEKDIVLAAQIDAL